MPIRYDSSSIGKTFKTKEGFLKTDAVVTRSGIFIYRNADGSARKEYRPGNEVFKADSLETMKMIPMTNDHPPTQTRLLDPSNVTQYQVGFTGENVRVEGETVRVPLTITDAATIAAIEAGKTGLSLGYDCDEVDEPGEFNGMRYDSMQIDIVYNHLAVVDSPRAGACAKIKLDSSDAAMFTEEKVNFKKELRMNKIVLDGIEYEASPEVVNAYNRAKTNLDSMTAELATVKSERDVGKAHLDSATAEIATLKARDINVEVSTAVKARLDLERKAVAVLDGVDVSEMSDTDIKKAIVVKVFPTAATQLDSASADYLNARVDSACEIFEAAGREDALASQRQQSVVIPGQKKVDEDDNDPQEAFAQRTRDAYKTDSVDAAWGSMSKKDVQ